MGAVNRWVSDGHVYFLHKVQPLAQSESDSGKEKTIRYILIFQVIDSGSNFG